jgi:hypothetical protein
MINSSSHFTLRSDPSCSETVIMNQPSPRVGRLGQGHPTGAH